MHCLAAAVRCLLTLVQADDKPCAMSDVSKALGERWRGLPADDKLVYTNKANADRAAKVVS
jgi:hypothetical protein